MSVWFSQGGPLFSKYLTAHLQTQDLKLYYERKSCVSVYVFCIYFNRNINIHTSYKNMAKTKHIIQKSKHIHTNNS